GQWIEFGIFFLGGVACGTIHAATRSKDKTPDTDIFRTLRKLDAGLMVDVKRYLFKLVPHRVVRDRGKVDYNIGTLKHVIRHISNITKILLIQFAFRQIVSVRQATRKIPGIKAHQGGIGIRSPELLNDAWAHITHISKYNDFHTVA